MSESKTQCVNCGVSILQRTADKHDGLCVPCYERAAAIPPKDFEMPRDLIERITSLNENPANYREEAWRYGVEFVCRTMDRIAERDDLYVKWSPKLREFVNECRVSNPSPAVQSLPAREQAKLPIYKSKIKKAKYCHCLRRRRRNENEVVFICLPVIAIPIAQRLWPGKNPRSVFLTPDELLQWEKIYTHPNNPVFRWFIHYWWNVEDPPEPNSTWTSNGELSVPNGEDPWLVVSGFKYEILDSGESAQLWSWNGEKAKLVKRLGHFRTTW